MLYFELGRYPLLYSGKYHMIKYWFKLLNTKNWYYTAYVELRSKCDSVNNWARQIRLILSALGLYELWCNQKVLNGIFYLPLIKQKIMDQSKQDLCGLLDTLLNVNICINI